MLVLVHGLPEPAHGRQPGAGDASRGPGRHRGSPRHGGSDKPTNMRACSMSAFADQVAALVDHAETETDRGRHVAGANAALELAARHPRLAPRSSRCRCSTMRWSPRGDLLRPDHPPSASPSWRDRVITNRSCSNYFVDMLLDGPAAARASGLCQATSSAGRRRARARLITLPTLVIGHPADPLPLPTRTCSPRGSKARLVNAESIGGGSARLTSSSSWPTSTTPSPRPAPPAPPGHPPCALEGR